MNDETGNKFHWASLKGDATMEPAAVEYQDGKPVRLWFTGEQEPFLAAECVIDDEITRSVELDPAGFSYMTPDRFRLLLKKLRLVQTPQPSNDNPDTSAPRMLGVGDRVVRRWADGSKAIPRAVALVLEIMVAYGIKPRDLKRLDIDDV